MGTNKKPSRRMKLTRISLHPEDTPSLERTVKSSLGILPGKCFSYTDFSQNEN